MENLIKDLENRKTGEKYKDFVIDDAIFHLKKALQCLDEGLNDPEQWYKDEMATAKIFTQLFPVIYQLQQTHNSPQKEEN